MTEFSDSQKAWENFQGNKKGYDLVITDQTMPLLTGAELARKILTIRPDIPIILCTGYSESITKESAYQLGVKGYLMKPVVKDDMARMIRQVLKKYGTGGRCWRFNGRHRGVACFFVLFFP